MLNRVLLQRSQVLLSLRRTASTSTPKFSQNLFFTNQYVSNNYRTFSTKQTKPGSDTTESEKQENQQKGQKEQFEEEEHQEFHHDESKDGNSHANFSTSRKIFFALGKAIKYSIWAYIVLFSYHFYLVRKKDKPEESFG